MIVVRVELHSAITGSTKEIACMAIANDGTQRATKGSYDAVTLRKGDGPKTRSDCSHALAGNTPGRVVRQSRVENYPRLSKPVWDLVAKCLKGMNYG